MANETKQPAAPPDPLQEEVEAAAAQFLIALAFIVERGTDVNAALGSHLDRYRRAIFATERQHHAAQLAEKDAEIGTLQALSSEREFIERERADCATDQLTAARAEIARLTERQLHGCETVPCPSCGWPNAPEMMNMDLICSCCGFEPEYDPNVVGGTSGYAMRWNGEWWDTDSEPPQIVVRLRHRAEAAEASLLALQQQMETLKAEVKRILTYVTLWLWDDDDPTTGPDLAIQVEEGLTAALASHLTGGPT